MECKCALNITDTPFLAPIQISRNIRSAPLKLTQVNTLLVDETRSKLSEKKTDKFKDLVELSNFTPRFYSFGNFKEINVPVILNETRVWNVANYPKKKKTI